MKNAKFSSHVEPRLFFITALVGQELTLHGKKANKGVFITISAFSKNARAYAADVGTNVIVIDGSQLVQLMIDHDVGVSEVSSYIIKKIDMDYFIEE